MKNPKSILITGASSGLGAALGKEYSGLGISLFLTGRNEERLSDVAAGCRLKGAIVTTCSIDVTDSTRLKNFIREADAEKPLDLVIANAGISEMMFSADINENSAEKVFSTNLNGVLNTIHPAIPLMKERRHGQIAIISSLASFRGLPSAPSYSASKAAVRFYAEALRGVLKNDGIGVTAVCPGFIKTPMTDINDFPMPLIISAEKAAKKIKRGLENNPRRIIFPLPLYLLMSFVNFLPAWMTEEMLSSLPKKGAQ